MAGTIEGGRKAAATNKERWGENFYHVQGAAGGRAGKTGGFASDKRGADGLNGRERAALYGSMGGKRSRPYTKTPKSA